MDTKKFVVGSIVGGIVYFCLGWLVYDVLLGDVMAQSQTATAAAAERMPPLFWSVGVACLLEAALICYALGSRSGAGAGAKAGAIVGLLTAGATDFMLYGFTTLSDGVAMMIVDMLIAAVVLGIVGAIIGLVAGKMKSA